MKPILSLRFLAIGLLFLLCISAGGKIDKYQPPKVIYHYGEKKFLLKDIAHGNVPQEDWDRYVMGEERRFQLLPFRRGLYGTVHPSLSEFFGDVMLGTEKEPWFMAISLKKECRQSDRYAVVSLLYHDQKFAAWFQNFHDHHFKSLKQFQNQCFKYKRSIKDYVALVENYVGQGGVCEEIIQKYFDEKNIGVVLDEAWPRTKDSTASLINPISWYVRDRDCIQNLEGTPKQMINMLGQIPGMWRLFPLNGLRRISGLRVPMGSSQFMILLSAMMDVENVDREVLQSIQKAVSQSDIPLIHPDKTSKQSRREHWLKALLPKVIDGYFFCQSQNRQQFFRETAKKLIDQSHKQSFLILESFRTDVSEFLQSIENGCEG